MTMSSATAAARPKPPLNLADDDDEEADVFSKLANSRSKPTSTASKSRQIPNPPSSKPKPTSSAVHATPVDQEDDDEDDYMSMAVADTSTTETPLQRLKRRKMEAAARGRPLSKAALAEQEKLKRDIGLSTSLMTSNSSSKGLKMMKAMGYSTGESLGKSSPSASAEANPDLKNKATIEPLRPVVRESRTGIGHDSELKRKFSEYTATESGEESETSKRQELSPESYRNRLTLEAQQRRHEAQLFAAQSICEKLSDEDPPENYDGPASGGETGDTKEGEEAPAKPSKRDAFWSQTPTFTQIKQINIIYRGLLYRRALSDLKARMRKDFETNGPNKAYINNPTLPTYNRDGEFEEDDKIALPTSKDINTEETMLEEEWEDKELEEFEKRETKDRLDEMVRYLRSQWRYCFWCKFRYASDEALENDCPGEHEEDHD